MRSRSAPFGSNFDETEMIQMYGALYFEDLLPPDPRGNERPLSLRGGRMWFAKLDRLTRFMDATLG